jgi:spermidine synthase
MAMAKVRFALLLMGFTSLIVQTLLIREFLISFYGNELTIGLILANWIILEAFGSGLINPLSLKSKRPYLVYCLLQTAIAVYLPVAIYLIRDVKNILGLTAGEGIGILPIFFSSLCILAPLSIFDGAQFPFGCRMLSDIEKKPVESAGKVYILEAMGFILAGPIFTYLLITRINSFAIAFLLGAVNLFSAALLLRKRLSESSSRTLFVLIGGLFFLSVYFFFGQAGKFHRYSLDKQWPNQKLLTYQNSIYGNLAVSESKNQYTFYSDGIPIIASPLPDITGVEEFAHFSMLAHPEAQNVLLLGGGAGGIIKEILKHPIKKMTYTELDPLLIKLVRDFPTPLTQEELSDQRLEIKYIDARRFLHITKSRYDLVILHLPMPSTLQLNRFYTQEFFQEVKSVLSEDGLFCFGLPGSLSYLNPQLRKLNGSILATLEDVFGRVNIIPGDFNLYLASKTSFQLSPQVFLSRLRERHIQTRLLSKFHLEYRLAPYWLDWFKDSLADYRRIRRNSDLLPSGTFYSIAYWNSAFSSRMQGLFNGLDNLNFSIIIFYLCLGTLGALLLKRFILRLKKFSIGFAIATTGFVGMSFNLIFIYAYQSFYGFVFSHLALLVTAFMTGITLGGWVMTKRLSRIKDDFGAFLKIELILAGFCLAVWLLPQYLKYLKPGTEFSYLFFVLSALAGSLVGLEFPLANKIYGKAQTYTTSAGFLYGLDLFGAWLAALIVSSAFVPVIGIIKTCLILAFLKAISFIFVFLFKD